MKRTVYDASYVTAITLAIRFEKETKWENKKETKFVFINFFMPFEKKRTFFIHLTIK